MQEAFGGNFQYVQQLNEEWAAYFAIGIFNKYPQCQAYSPYRWVKFI